MKRPSSAQLELAIASCLASAPPVSRDAETSRRIEAEVSAIMGSPTSSAPTAGYTPTERIQFTRHGSATAETKRAAKAARARGDVAEIDRLEREVAREIGDDPRHALPGSTRSTARVSARAARKARSIIVGGVDANPAAVSAYEAKQEAKRERLESAAEKAKARSEAAFGRARTIADGIPFGQPILVGHHSEKRHRRDVAKIDSGMRKGIEESKHAAQLANRAANVGSGGISSDDPAAVRKLKEELVPLRRDQERMAAANKALRAYAKAGPEAQVTAIVATGIPDKVARKLLEPDFAGRLGFPAYVLTNNGANIRRIEKRIEELSAKASAPARTPTIADVPGVGGVTIEDNADLNRTQIRFANGKPPDAIRAKLKSAAFKWAPSEGAWQRHSSNGAWHHAHVALGLPVPK